MSLCLPCALECSTTSRLNSRAHDLAAAIAVHLSVGMVLAVPVHCRTLLDTAQFWFYTKMDLVRVVVGMLLTSSVLRCALILPYVSAQMLISGPLPAETSK
ncbi:hypothetical protein DFH06DRAFT_435403 [Mycena polygramma]|nr:hypothetical protein DFH06DRAFT_435403 [Mycena polygramma]